MTFSILGSGFGLYGYLPALIRCGHRVMLPESYRETLERRADLKGLVDAVQWRKDEEAIRDEATACIISRRPSDQSAWLDRFAGTARATSFILEKPLGTTPASAFKLLDLLEASHKKYRIAYTFRFLPWAQDLAAVASNTDTANNPGHIGIEWTFRSHHYLHQKQNWKRRVSEGGGALRFYGIHIIGLLAEIGYRDVAQSRCCASAPDECEFWSAVFNGPGLKECHVLVDTNSDDTTFKIVGFDKSHMILDQAGPFQSTARSDGFDARVEVLERLCKSLTEETARFYPWYAASIELWKLTETVSRQVQRTPD